MPSLEVRGRVSADGKPWENTLRRAQAQAGQFAGAVNNTIGPAIAGAFSVAAVVAFGKSVTSMAGDIKDTAVRLGITTGEVQKFSFAADRNKASLEMVAGGLDKLAKGLEDVKEGAAESEKLASAFERLGVSAADIASKSPAEIFKQLSSSLENATITGQVTDDIITVLGKSGGKLIPTMKALREEGDKLKNSFAFLSDDEIQKLDEAGKKSGFLVDNLKAMGARAVIAATNPYEMITRAVDEMLMTPEQESNRQAGARADALRNQLNAEAAAKPKAPETASAEDLEALKRAQHQNEQDEVNKIEKETAKITQQAAEARMTDEEKLVALAKERAAIYEKINSLQYEPGTLKRAELDKRLAEIGLAEASASKKEKKGSKFDVPTDSLVRVGNFLGATSANAINAISQRQLDKLSSIDRYIKLMYERGAYGGAASSLSSNTP